MNNLNKKCNILMLSTLVCLFLQFNCECSLAKTPLMRGKINNTPSASKISSKKKPNELNVIKLANIYIDNKQYDLADDLLNNALQFYPYSSKLFSTMAKLAFLKSDFVGAEQLAQEAILINPKTLTSYLVLGDIYCDMAEVLQETEQIDKYLRLANENYLAVLKKDKTFYDAYLGISKIHRLRGEEEEEFGTLCLVKSFDEFNPKLYYYFAHYYNRKSNFEFVVRDLKQSIKYSKTPDIKLNLFLAQTYEKLADIEKAIEQYKIILQLNANNEYAIQRLDMLEKL